MYNSGLPQVASWMPNGEFSLPSANSDTIPDSNDAWLPRDADPFSSNSLTDGVGIGQWAGTASQELQSLLAQIARLVPQAYMNSQQSNPGQSFANEGYPYPPSTGNVSQAAAPEYTSLQASSTGDPHESCTATTANGATSSAHWDSMQSHQDVFHTSSFTGGLSISSETTAPNAQGKTMNGEISIATDGGANQIRYDANGDASVYADGSWQNLTAGQQETLADGTSLCMNAQNQLQVTEQNAQGGSLQVTLQNNGQGGVDMSLSGNNLDAGGYLMRNTR